MLEPKMGRPQGSDKKLDPTLIPLIVEGYTKTLAMRRAAGWAMVSPYHLKRWLKQGEEDVLNEINSDYAQLFYQVARIISEKASSYIEKIERCVKNYNGLTWLMEKTMKEDYGVDSVEYKELLDLYNKLVESYKRFTENPLQGVVSNGREMDIKGD